MTDRFPLIINSEDQQIQELSSGDNLDLTGSGIVADVFTVDTNSEERLRIDSLGRMGIGLTNPSVKLHADGSDVEIRASDNASSKNISLYGGSSSNDPAITFTDALRFYSNSGSGERMRIDSSGRLLLNGGTDVRMEFGTTGTTGTNNRNHIRGDGSNLKYNTCSGGLHIFEQNGNEAMRIDTDGSASFAGETIVKGDLLKRTAAGSTVVAMRDDYLRVYDSPVSYDDYTISLEKDGSATFAGYGQFGSSTYGYRGILALNNDAGGTIYSRNHYSGGAVFEGASATGSSTSHIYENGSATFGSDGDQAVKAGHIARATSNVNAGVGFANFGIPGIGIHPCNATGTTVDNALIFGVPGGRWKVVYAATGSINTSDANEKQDVRDLEASELAAATELKTMIKAYRWKDAVAAKGDDARIHFGVIAQDVQSMFTKHGLDASKYGFWCSDTWYELDGDVVHPDENGEYPEGVTPKTRLGIRYDELFAFIISAL